MKVRALLLAGILFPVFCFAQTQTGNASYNAAKNGLHISHASMSFNTRVRVTNLSNNQQVIATVDGRIPASDPRIADIAHEVGDAIGMSHTGYTRVLLEEILPEHAAAPAPVPAPAPDPAPVQQTSPAPVPVPVPAPVQQTAPAPAPVQQTAPAQQTTPAPVPTPAPVRQTTPAPIPAPAASPAPVPVQEPAVEIIETIVSPPPVQYVMVDRPVQTCAASPLCVAILILAIIAVLLLTAILVLLCRGRAPQWPWYYPVWVRRHIRYKRSRRF
ncbi:MAG: hypothetical protein LBL56_04675 [Treponema sp.]|nr:hypothetical protein [Treponema sp.]